MSFRDTNIKPVEINEIAISLENIVAEITFVPRSKSRNGMKVLIISSNIRGTVYRSDYNNKKRDFHHLMLLTTVVTQTEHSTVMSHNSYKSCKSCLCSMELLSLPGRHH
jgi:hypothetical protein